ncbi:MAG: SpoIVB peptidase S55 [Acidobacteriota bacterium]
MKALRETAKSSGWAASLAATALFPALLIAQTTAVPAGPPPSAGGFYPESQVHRGLMATAWTVFTGTRPEPMQVEILGILKNARGPGHDMILARLKGAKPEYTGVVAGMSGSPVYVGDKLLGSLSYRIGQFSKEPIAGITPIQQMLEVRDMPIGQASGAREHVSENQGVGNREQGVENQNQLAELRDPDSGELFQPMETPLSMTGFSPAAVQLWQQKMAGTGLEMVAAGGGSGSSDAPMSASARKTIVPGSAISALLVRGDLEIAATCTVTYVDPEQLLACGHPILQAGSVSLPMTTADVVATLPSPLNAFKIVNTGVPVGAFTQDRDSAIRGVFGAQAHMIPVHVSVHGAGKPRTVNVEVLDLPSLTPQAVLVSVYNSLLQTNQSTAEMSYHVTGAISVDNFPPTPIDAWVSSGEQLPSSLGAAMQVADRFNRIYSNEGRRNAIKSVDVNIEAVPRRVSVELISARLISNDIVHAGDTVTVEATLRPWRQPERNVRIPIKLPSRLQAGTLRVLVSDAGTLDRTLNQPKLFPQPTDMNTLLAQARAHHPEDQVYVSLLVPETQAGIAGHTLSTLPISMANALEPLRTAQDVTLNGESAVPVTQMPAGGVLNGFDILSLHIDPGAGVN